MTTNRREFLGTLSASAMLGTLPLSDIRFADILATEEAQQAREEFDMSWTAKVAGKKHKACFDCAEIDGGTGPLRASMWENQYVSTLGADRADIMTVMILRHNAAVLALTQEMWDKYGIGAQKGAKSFLTDKETDKNPILMSAADGVPANVEGMLLKPFLSRGGVVLVCGVALRNWSGTIATKDGVSREEAYKRTLAGLVPGTIVQPSGVFAAVRAGQEGCSYVRAS
jgi:hypothetical protein